jgi:hypothetical protein
VPSVTEAHYELLGSDLSLLTDRANFLHLIEELAPDVLSTLAGEPFEGFQRAWMALKLENKNRPKGNCLRTRDSARRWRLGPDLLT